MSESIGISSLAIGFPEEIRPNAWWAEHHPEMVETARERALAQLWGPADQDDAFGRAMRPYVQDPFKGALERRVLRPGEGSLGLERSVVEEALRSRGIGPHEVDLYLVCSLRPDTHAVGNAAYLVRDLGVRVPAIDLEAACSGSVVGLDVARAMIAAGRYRRVVVVTSCTYSRDTPVTDTLSWFLADGAGAFVVEAGPEVAAWQSAEVVNTANTCGAFFQELAVVDGEAQFVMRTGPGAGKILRETAAPLVHRCCAAALDGAGLSAEDVDFAVFNTPTAWYAEFCASVLGIDPERTISTYPIYTNLGPALMPVNLFHAARSGRIAPGDNVLLYSVGSSSTAAAVVLRWGADVHLGAPPPPPRTPRWDPSRAG